MQDVRPQQLMEAGIRRVEQQGPVLRDRGKQTEFLERPLVELLPLRGDAGHSESWEASEITEHRVRRHLDDPSLTCEVGIVYRGKESQRTKKSNR